MTATFLDATLAALLDVAEAAPTNLPMMSDGIGIENIHRIGAALIRLLGLPEATSARGELARSFAYVQPLRQFVEHLSSSDAQRQIAEILRNITATAKVGVHLVDLAGRSMVRPSRFRRVCAEAFRRYRSEDCALSDVGQLWRALFRHRALPPRGEAYVYSCPGGLTEVFWPVTVAGLAAGGMFAGQLLQSEGQRDRVLSLAASLGEVTDETVNGWRTDAVVLPPESTETVKCLCRGLADLVSATFGEWCRAESESGIRSGLIEASEMGDVRNYAAAVCRVIKQYIPVTECSVWMLRGQPGKEKLVLEATTEEYLFSRTNKDRAPMRTPAKQLIGNAFYELGEGLTGTTASQRESIRVDIASADNRWFGKYSGAPPNASVSYMSTALLRGENIVGVIRASRPTRAGKLTKAEAELFTAVGKEIAIGLHDESLTEQALNNAQRYEYLMKATAHESRQPLQSILSLLHALGIKLDRLFHQTPLDEQERKAVVAEIRTDAQGVREEALRAKRQMDNALAADSEMAFDFRPLSLGALFREAETEFIVRSGDRNVRLIVHDGAKGLPCIQMDHVAIGQVISNLLDNAVKYSFKGERVYVDGKDMGNTVHFSVQNRGLGIPSEFQTEIFEPFRRKVVLDPKRFIAGTGLGLPIVSQIVKGHGGTITVESVPFLRDARRQRPEDGHIVTFTVEIPKTQKGGSQ